MFSSAFTQHFRNCCSTALKLLPDTHHGCVLIPGIYNRSLVFSNRFLLPPFLRRKWTDKTWAGAFFQYKNCSDFFPGQRHRFHSYQLGMALGKLFSQCITLTMSISVFFLFSSFLKFLSFLYIHVLPYFLPTFLLSFLKNTKKQSSLALSLIIHIVHWQRSILYLSFKVTNNFLQATETRKLIKSI